MAFETKGVYFVRAQLQQNFTVNFQKVKNIKKCHQIFCKYSSHDKNSSEGKNSSENSKFVLRGFQDEVEVKNDPELFSKKSVKQRDQALKEVNEISEDWISYKKELKEKMADFVEAVNSGVSVEEVRERRQNSENELQRQYKTIEEDDEDSEGWEVNFSDIFPANPEVLPPDDLNELKPTSYKEILDEDRVDLSANYDHVEILNDLVPLNRSNWKKEILGSRFPVVICCHSAYGSQIEMSRKMTEEAKEAAKLLFEFEKSPVKFASVDLIHQPFIRQALEDPPMCSLLFMRNNKKVFQVEGFVPAEEQMQLVAHFFFGAPKNLTVDKFS